MGEVMLFEGSLVASWVHDPSVSGLRNGNGPKVTPAPVTRLPIDDIRLGETPRLGEVDLAHLAVVVELGGSWPPLLVTKTRRIIDGHYRYLAARRLGHPDVACLVFDGDETDAFIEAVHQNITQGLPLTLRERKQAAGRILIARPGWSDRRIAELCGLAHKTVGRLRQAFGCQDGEIPHLDRRQGRDGKSRAVDPAGVRARIVRAIEQQPSASLRHLARLSGSSHETVRAVRRQSQQSDEPTLGVPSGDRCRELPVSPATDAAFLSTPAGVSFAEWFERTSIADEWIYHGQSVPLSRVYEIADEARRRAKAWTDFAASLNHRTNPHGN
jgi:ParB-like chromosome segregation protein Spo0J